MMSCPVAALLTAPGVEEGEPQGHVEGEDAQQVDNVQEREDEAYLQHNACVFKNVLYNVMLNHISRYFNIQENRKTCDI